MPIDRRRTLARFRVACRRCSTWNDEGGAVCAAVECCGTGGRRHRLSSRSVPPDPVYGHTGLQVPASGIRSPQPDLRTRAPPSPLGAGCRPALQPSFAGDGRAHATAVALAVGDALRGGVVFTDSHVLLHVTARCTSAVPRGTLDRGAPARAASRVPGHCVRSVCPSKVRRVDPRALPLVAPSAWLVTCPDVPRGTAGRGCGGLPEVRV